MYATQHETPSSGIARPIHAAVWNLLTRVCKRVCSCASLMVAELNAMLGIFSSHACAVRCRTHLDVSEHIRRDAGLLPDGEGMVQADPGAWHVSPSDRVF